MPQVSDERWLPLLQQISARKLTFRQGSRPDLDPVAAVMRLALKRWYELDPQTAREAILKEIASPLPRFGEDAPGILPDATLPVEQHLLAKHFASLGSPAPIVPSVANKDEYLHRFDAMAAQLIYEANVASLLFRYGDQDVLPEVLPLFQSPLAERNCNAQYTVAFLLKIGSGDAASFLHQVAADRPVGRAACVVGLYPKIGSLVESPVLENFAIESLNDEDLRVASEALRYLSEHGTAKAEGPIFLRLISWNRKWRGRVSELIPATEPISHSTPEFNPNQAERSFGMELAQALARGHAWHEDPARIRQIFSLALDPAADADAATAINELKKTQPR